LQKQVTMKRSMAAAVMLGLVPSLGAAQQDTTRLPTGVELATRYTVQHQVALTVRPFSGPPALGSIAAQIREIVERNLDYSDRFNLVPSPDRLADGEVEYALWNNLNVVWLVTGELALAAEGYRLHIALHDVVYGRVRDARTFALPSASAAGFRMAVHGISDEIVRWATGQPGAAATQVVFTRQNQDGSSDLMLVDADGENLRRIAGSAFSIYAPAWSPDGRRLLYSVKGDNQEELVERNVATGATRVVQTGGLITTPAFSPDGRRIYFAMWANSATLLHEYDLARGCCLRRVTSPAQGRIDMAPTFSPQGDRVAFLSNRLGPAHVFVMNANGGGASVLSPFVAGEGGEYHSPAWSPTGSQIVFHGRSRGKYQIMLADATRIGAPVQQLTAQGQNEDPSWAPDGRHVVFTAREGLGGGPPGLYVIDAVTGRTRLLVRGARLRMADWSPALVRAADLAAADR
jgi:TolB protein